MTGPAPRPAPRTVAALAAVGFGLALYLPTMAREVGFIDRGELAAVAVTLGIAHPTGYPTFTLLGHLVTRLVPANPLLALNVFAAVAVALGLGGLVLLFEHVLASLAPERPGRRALVAWLAALATGVTGFWWQQANGYEVYALQALALPLVSWLFLRWVDALPAGGSRAAPPPPAGPGAARRGLLFAFALGLTFTNHMTTILLAPAFLVAYGLRARGAPGAITRLVPLVPAFLLGLTPYLYLPLRAAQGPRFDWGDPDSAWRFWTHVTGRQYQVWMFSGIDVARQQIGFFVARLPGEYAGVGLAVIALGAVRLARRRPALALWAALVFAACVGYLGAYAIRDIDSYTLAAMMALGVCLAAGLLAIAERAGDRAAAVVGVLLVAVAAIAHARDCDESANTLPDHLTRDVLAALPRDAVLITSQWDYVVGPSYYLQSVAGVRPDVTIADPELMRRRWYLAELARRAPAFAATFEPERRAFEREVVPFERGRRFDAGRIEAAYETMLSAMVERSLPRRPVFVSWEVGGPWLARPRVPQGLAYRITTDTSYVAVPPPRITWRRWPNRVDAYVATTSAIYADLFESRAIYEAAHGHGDRARADLGLALEFDPRIDRARLPALPLDGRALVLQAVDLFDRLHAAAVAFDSAAGRERPGPAPGKPGGARP